MKSTTTDDPKMETRVLMPAEFSLVVTPRPLPPLDRLVPLEDCIKVCTTKPIPVSTSYLPFSGTVRADNLPLLPYLAPLDVRSRYGGYDSMDEAGRRTCNWVRFLKVSTLYSHEVNVIGRRVGSRADVVFEVVKEIPSGGELIAFLIPDCSGEDSLFLPALQFLRSSLYRKTIDSIMAEAPLDLSRSLFTSPSAGARKSSREDSPRLAHGSSDAEDTHSDSSPLPSPSSSSPHSPTSCSDFSSSNYFSTTHSAIPSFVPKTLFPPDFRLSHMTSLFTSGFPRIPTSALPSPPSSNPSPSVPSSGRMNLSGSSDESPKPSSCHSSCSALPKRRERTMLPCSECGKAFDRPSLLKRHMRTHTGEKPHVCDVCGKGFSTSSSLNTHRRIHSGEKPHQCGVCGKRFTASSNLYYHKMTHIKEKPHKCTLCTRSFPTPGDLRSHMFVHNGQWPHKCGVCGKGFSKLTNLRNHSLLHSSKNRVTLSTSPTALPTSIMSSPPHSPTEATVL